MDPSTRKPAARSGGHLQARIAATTVPLFVAVASAQPGSVNPLSVPDPSPLARGPWWELILLEHPLFAAAAFVLGAIVVFVRFNSAGKLTRGAMLAAVLLLLGAGVYVLGSMVDTPRERMQRVTRELIAAVRYADTAAADRVLEENASLSTFLGAISGRREIADRIDEYFRVGGPYELREAAILELQAATDGPEVGRTQVKVRATSREGVPNFSWWRLNLRRRPDASWGVQRIEPLSIQGISNPSR